jgi:hypothetical protein
VPLAGSTLRLEWNEAGRTVRVHVAKEGLPDTVTVTASNGGAVRVEYVEWMRAGAARVPREFHASNQGSRSSLRCRIERLRVRAAADSSDFAGPGPRDATLEPGCELWHMVSGGGGP